MGGIGGLSVRVGGGAWGVSGTKACTESGSVLFVMLEIVVESVWTSVCVWFSIWTCVQRSEGLSVLETPSQLWLSVQLLCETEVLKHFLRRSRRQGRPARSFCVFRCAYTVHLWVLHWGRGIWRSVFCNAHLLHRKHGHVNRQGLWVFIIICSATMYVLVTNENIKPPVTKHFRKH